MKKAFVIIVALVLALPELGHAANPFDGKWEGSVRGGRRAAACQGLSTVTIRDGRVFGATVFQRGRARRSGIVDADGTFHGIA